MLTTVRVQREHSMCHGCGEHIQDAYVRVFCDGCLGEADERWSYPEHPTNGTERPSGGRQGFVRG